MSYSNSLRVVWRTVLCLSLGMLGACNLPEPPQSNHSIPTDYASKHMPEGWWTDQAILQEGQQLYLGKMKPDVNCAKCHGENGKPIKSGARNFRDTDNMKKYSDSHIFWRISEGVPYSTMGPFKDKITEDEIWKVIVFVSTLGMDGLQYDPDTKGWVPAG